jgi:hypothetical protein
VKTLILEALFGAAIAALILVSLVTGYQELVFVYQGF